ncbi:hypothetical protein P3342_009729 [Pyrenophora teres f. teres]|nr:hypothetical protein P3342_009729 [Pyrenophora teres f. teres]
MAYGSDFSARHGGGFDPNSGGAFVQIQPSQQNYPGKAHAGGGNYDPNSGAFVQLQPHQQNYPGRKHTGGGAYDPNNPNLKPPFIVQAQPVPHPQPIFPAQAPNHNYSQPYYPYQQQPLQHHNTQPGFITQLCGCFK